MEIEICCNSIQSAINAKTAGATRIELCQNLNEGGTTPSWATIDYCVHTLGLDVFVLVRPRPGNFIYNPAEIEVMERDIRICKEHGVAGIVIGSLTADGQVDIETTKRLTALSHPTPVTFHRAFDRCRDWSQALEDVVACGCDRILTSGCHNTAIEGKEVIRQLVRQAAGRITILAGSGINAHNAEELIQHTGVTEIHGSCKVLTDDDYMETSTQAVKELLHICAALS